MPDNSVVIAVRVDLDQHEKIKTAARRAGMPMSTWVRSCALLHAPDDDTWKRGVFQSPVMEGSVQ